MHRNSHPTAPGGHHTDGDPARGIAPTVVPAATMEALQEELANFILSRGITLNKQDNTQLKQAILDAIDKIVQHEFQQHTPGVDPHPQYALKNSLREAAFMDTGTTPETVAKGDHTHSQYELKSNLKAGAYRDVGSGAEQVAQGNHSHSQYITQQQLNEQLQQIAQGVRKPLHWGYTQQVGFNAIGVNRLFILYNTSGYGWAQHEVDIALAVSIGEIRIYNRGGENADRNYDTRIAIGKSGDWVTLSTQGLWPNTAILGVVGY
ncbi:MAG: hypothetical protein ACRC4V_03315 [Aeromonas veronii]